jgi:predicted N-acetyltransferase YhbS
VTSRHGGAVVVERYLGAREDLRELFELAEDSRPQLDAYIEAGEVLVARDGPDTIGHAQLVPTGSAGVIELKNLAVATTRQRSGIGRRLVDAAIARARCDGWTQLVVATAAADVGNLRFYQRLGFRFFAVERDAFTPATGYPDLLVIDGIPLRDRVWLSLELTDGAN